MTELASIKQIFRSYQIIFSDIWLESCLNWIKQENPTCNDLNELKQRVYEQWLLLDLRDVELPVLPSNLSQQKLVRLQQNVCLQMMQIIDISKPKLWQFNRIQNANALTRAIQKDQDIVGCGKRVLQLTLTDGVQQVEAVEYRLIACLNLNMAPGTKIKLIAPLVVRRGRIMLEPHNVKVLGGEVEDLLVSYATENVLARALNLPVNPNPKPIKEQLLIVEEERHEGYSVQQAPQAIPVVKPAPKPIKRTFQQMECDFDDDEIDKLLEYEQDMVNNTLFNENNPAEFEENSRVFSSTQINNSINKQEAKRSLAPPVPPPTVFEDEDDDLFSEIDFDAAENVAPQPEVAEILPKTNILPIAKLLATIPNIVLGNFKIRAKFKSVVEKLTIEDREYYLVIKIEDESSEITVRVQSDIVEQFSGCSFEEILELRRSDLEKNGDAKKKLLSALQKVRDKLLLLDSVMMIQVNKEERFPILKELL